MQINVLSQLRQRIGSVSVYDIQEMPAVLTDIQLQSLTGTLKLLRTDRGILASFNAQAMMKEVCSRCVKDVDSMVSLDFEEEYIPVIDADTGARIHGGAPDDFRIGSDFILDLREGLRQYVLVSEPIQPLCSPNCAGLCPSCGNDLNNGTCGCHQESDARWGALTSLRLGKEEGS